MIHQLSMLDISAYVGAYMAIVLIYSWFKVDKRARG